MEVELIWFEAFSNKIRGCEPFLRSGTDNFCHAPIKSHASTTEQRSDLGIAVDYKEGGLLVWILSTLEIFHFCFPFPGTESRGDMHTVAP